MYIIKSVIIKIGQFWNTLLRTMATNPLLIWVEGKANWLQIHKLGLSIMPVTAMETG